MTVAVTAQSPSGLLVRDGRLDKQLYMTAISFSSTSHMYLLRAEPPIEDALERHIHTAISKVTPALTLEKAEVTIEAVDLKNRVGFAKADELYCTIESRVVVTDDAAKPIERTVKTFSKNGENMSPLVTTAAKVILDQCLYQHAVELVASIAVSQ